ncbi:MAG: type II toxin-antitoxin system VapC family toxin [Verrucomicrobiota bacterium]
MTVLVDTNVISDVLHADIDWEPWAVSQLFEHFGGLVINPIIYAELSCRAASVQELEDTLAPFELHFLEIPKQALFLAAQAFLVYRQRGGNKTSPLPDFFIGAHAEVLGIPILTRDVTRYRSYFPKVQLISP